MERLTAKRDASSYFRRSKKREIFSALQLQLQFQFSMVCYKKTLLPAVLGYERKYQQPVFVFVQNFTLSGVCLSVSQFTNWLARYKSSK